MEGSKWACRESFVSIIVANLPIIQPLIRRGASKIGLSALFSNSGPSSYGRGPSGGRRREGDYPLASQEVGTGKSRTGTETGGGWKSRRLRGFGSTVHHSTAMGSDEEILFEGGRNGNGKGNNQITVTHETVIEREEASPTGSPTRNEHGHGQESVSGANGGAWDGGVRRG